jgi:hypothetical protein
MLGRTGEIVMMSPLYLVLYLVAMGLHFGLVARKEKQDEQGACLEKLLM